MKSICISLGGSLLSGPGGFNTEYVMDFVRVVKREKNTNFIVVCGGGHHARMLIGAARDAGVKNNIELDKIGMEVTRLNALVLREIFQAAGMDVVPFVPNTIKDLRHMLGHHRIMVCGGFVEGVTTDTDAALTAEIAQCTLLINISKLGYVYDKDPKKHAGAKRQAHLTYRELIEIAQENDNRMPGSNVIFDTVAANLVARSRIEVRFVDGNIKDLEAAIHRRPHHGTTVGPR